MASKKRVYESDVMALPPLRMVLGEVPEPDPGGKKKNARKADKIDDREMESMVKRLIAHLRENQK
jgi:hypothetical protein